MSNCLKRGRIMQTKTKYIFGILSTTLLVLAFAGCVIPIEKIPIEKERTTFSEFVTNPCNNERVLLFGEIHIAMPPGSGRKDEATGHINIQGKGVGDQNQYVVNGEANIKMNEDISILNVNVISKGKDQNFMSKIRYHVVKDKVIIDSSKEECTGKIEIPPTPGD